MKTSDLMQALADAGAPMEAILIAVRAMEEKDAQLEHKRAVERDRKRRQRAKEQDKDGTVPGPSRDTDGTVTDNPSLSPPPLSSPQTPQQTPRPHTHPDIIPRAQGPWEQHVLDWQEWRKANPFPRPWWADKQVWADWLAVRKAKKARNTITAHNGFLRDVDKHSDAEWPPGKLLEHAAARSWLSINRPEEQKHGRKPLQPANGIAGVRGNRPNPALDMVLEAERELAAQAYREDQGFDWPSGLALPPN